MADLASLASEIRTSHEAVHTAYRTSLEHARAAGEKLATAKKLVRKAGVKWLDWLQENCRLTVQTAQNYMAIFKYWDCLEENEAGFALGIKAALRTISAGRKPKKNTHVLDLVQPQHRDLADRMKRFGLRGKLENVLAFLASFGIEGSSLAAPA